MEDIKANTNQTGQRDYDKDPIIIKNFSILFESYLILIIAIFAIPLLFMDIYKLIVDNGIMTFKLIATICAWIYLIYIIFVFYPKKFKDKPSYFLFKQNTIQYHYKYLQKKKDDLILTVNTDRIQKVSYSIINELPDSFGRWNIDSTWKKKRKYSIDIDFSELVLLIRYLVTYILFVLPCKLYRLIKANESLKLLSKNIFIRFSNRNYFLVNIYSQKELDELMEYFKVHDIQTTDKTYLIPHLQNQGWFVDKEEIWSDDFNNTKQDGLGQLP